MDFTQPTTYLWLIPLGVVAIAFFLTFHINDNFDRSVIFRLGRFSRIAGSGLYLTIPFIESVFESVDTRVLTDSVNVDKAMTKDTVPVSVEAILFWHVLDTPDAVKSATMAVEDYHHSIELSAQTALRDVIGQTNLADLLSNRDMVDAGIATKIASRAAAWGIEVTSVEILDVSLPDELTDAMSRQAQAERERQARVILAQSEVEAAQKFVEAAKTYEQTPTAIHLRGMNMLYEGLKEKGALMIVPSSALSSMDLGSLAAIGNTAKPTVG